MHNFECLKPEPSPEYWIKQSLPNSNIWLDADQRILNHPTPSNLHFQASSRVPFARRADLSRALLLVLMLWKFPPGKENLFSSGVKSQFAIWLTVDCWFLNSKYLSTIIKLFLNIFKPSLIPVTIDAKGNVWYWNSTPFTYNDKYVHDHWTLKYS